MKKVFSFSSNKTDDIEFLNGLKTKFNRMGMNFSHFVVEALKEKVENDKRRATN